MWFSCKKTNNEHVIRIKSVPNPNFSYFFYFGSSWADWWGRASPHRMFRKPLWIWSDVWYFLILTSLLILIPGARYFCERAGRPWLCSSCVMFICGGWRSSSSRACGERWERYYSLLLRPKIWWKSPGDSVHGAPRWERLFRWSVPPKHNDFKWID